MAQQTIPIEIDPDVFVRTASLFNHKRETLGQDTVVAFASQIVEGLTQVRMNQSRLALPEIDAFEIAAFCDALVEPDPDAALRFIARRRAEGLTRREVYLGYVGAAARKLGEDWDNDRISFADVTIGSGHLYALMRAMKAEDPPDRTGSEPRRYALFATLPHETHGIGITVAAEVFRQSGWEIDLQIGRDHDEIVSIVQQTRAEVIGLSLSTEDRLQDLIRLVLALRLVAPHAIIGVATGDAFDDEKIVMFADIDLVFADAPSACTDLERLLRARA